MHKHTGRSLKLSDVLFEREYSTSFRMHSEMLRHIRELSNELRVQGKRWPLKILYSLIAAISSLGMQNYHTLTHTNTHETNSDCHTRTSCKQVLYEQRASFVNIHMLHLVNIDIIRKTSNSPSFPRDTTH
jgi:hypothetical protein